MPNDAAATQPIISAFADDPDMQELVELFVDEMPDRIEAVHAAFQSGDVATLTRLAHQLKGAAPGYGFDQVGDVAASLERSLDGVSELTVQAEAITAQVNELIGVCKRVSLTP